MQFGFARAEEWTWQCFYADSSAFRGDAFYLQAFVLPRFVPTDHLHFDYGFRIGDQWEAVTAEVVERVRAAVPELERLATLDGLEAKACDAQNVRHAELRLCIAALRGDEAAFARERAATAGWDVALAWETEVVERCALVADAVDDGGFGRATAVLADRRAGVDRLIV